MVGQSFSNLYGLFQYECLRSNTGLSGKSQSFRRDFLGSSSEDFRKLFTDYHQAGYFGLDSDFKPISFAKSREF
jgi:hypothetical protein